MLTWCRRFRWALLLPLLALLLAPGPRAGAQRGRAAEHVVLISIDGFGAENLDNPRLPLPNLRRLAAEGARADRMTVVTPSVTWPNHTSLVTGVYPAKHGVLANGMIEPSTRAVPWVINPRRTKAELCRAPTIYDVAHAAGLRTGEVNWPVTRGAPTLHWSFPDHPEPLRYTTPSFREELVAQRILPGPEDAAFSALGSVMRDAVWTDSAAHLIRRHRPNLLLLHLLLTDSTQHAHGPQTTEALAALALADRQVGDIIRALNDAGIRDETALFVVADHGFIRVTHQIQPNARLRKEGLIHQAATEPEPQYDAFSVAEGGVALVYVPAGRLRPELVARTRAALEGLEGVERILTPEQYEALGLPSPARSPQAPAFVLTARDGYAFTNVDTGQDIVALPRPVGTHGYVHTNPKMDALFVASGAGIRKGVRLERVRNLDVAPTIARLLNVDLPGVDGRPLESILGAADR